MAAAGTKVGLSVTGRWLQCWGIYLAVLVVTCAALWGSYHMRSQATVDPRTKQTQATNALLGAGVLTLLLAWLVPGQIALNMRNRVVREIARHQPEVDFGSSPPPPSPAQAGDDRFWAVRYLIVYSVRLGLLLLGALALALCHLLEGPPNPVAGADKVFALGAGTIFVLAIGWQFPTRLRILYWAHTQRNLVLQVFSPTDDRPGFF